MTKIDELMFFVATNFTANDRIGGAYRELKAALEAALVQGEPEKCPQCHGTGWYDEGHECDDGTMVGGNYVECKKCAAPSAPPAPVQGEPLGWIWRFDDGEWDDTTFRTKEACEQEWSEHFGVAVPLFTAPPAPVQGEPVAAQHRFRLPQKTMPDWSEWQPAAIADRPAYAVDSVGYEVEYRLLYTAPPAQTPPPRLMGEQVIDLHPALYKLDADTAEFARAIESAVRKQAGWPE